MILSARAQLCYINIFFLNHLIFTIKNQHCITIMLSNTCKKKKCSEGRFTIRLFLYVGDMIPLKKLPNYEDLGRIILNAFLSKIINICFCTTVQDLRSFNVVDLF